MKNVKFYRLIRILQILLVLTLLASVCLLVVACKCQHDYDEKITTPATCGKDGERTYTCSKCGDSYVETIDATGEHELSAVYLKEDGVHWQKCCNCDYVTDKAAHKFDTVVSDEPSTCTKQGSVVKSCVCGQISTETLDLAEHDYKIYQKQGDEHWLKCANCDSTTQKVNHEYTVEVKVTPSTCTKQGSVIKSCVCGATFTETLPLAQHKYTKTIFDDNEHWTVCFVCGAENPDLARSQHTLITSITEAQCVKNGTKVTTCEHCDYIRSENIPALGHDLDKSAFSSSSTGSGHYYKCSRCGDDVAEQHILADYDCSENRAPTCYKIGIQYQQCTVCGWLDHIDIPMTNDHKWSEEWSSNGTFHWHACLNGDGQCDAKGDEVQHSWITKIIEAKCEENGREWRECSVCGQVQSGSNKILNATGHDNEIVKVVKTPTCTETGEAAVCCKTCGATSTAEIKPTGHKMTSYNMERTDADGHYRQCSVCGFTSETSSGHTWDSVVIKEANCTETGTIDRTCQYCKYHYVQTVAPNGHSYVTDPDSIVDPTCKDYGYHVCVCSVCGDRQTVTDEHLGYAEHTPIFYPAKEMTDTEPGNIRYWQCTVCKRYFTGHGCNDADELTAEEIFTYPPTSTVIDSVARLIEIGLTLPDNEISENYYQVTTSVVEAYPKASNDPSAKNTLMIGDSECVFATLNDRENIDTINVGDTITIKGKLVCSDESVELIECQIISVDAHNDKLHSVFIYATEEYVLSSEVYLYAEIADDYLFANTNNYNCISDGETLKFTVYSYNGIILQKVIVNGKSRTVTKGELSLTVTEDITVEFVFSTHNHCSVTVTKIDTSNNNGAAIDVDEYVSYTYTNGGYNDYGRLYKDSHLTFNVENANITGINITYDADWLKENPDVLNNTVNAIKANGVKVKVEQGSANGNSQIKITVSASDACKAIEYFANQKQARVIEITVLYDTNNTCSSY